MIADRNINFEGRLELKICPDEQTFDAEHKISIDIRDTMICGQISVKG
jgi:hypothetical protein